MEIKLKCRGRMTLGMLLFQDNMPIHTTQVTVTEATNCGFELPPNPHYSPDLAPSDFFLFPKFKSHQHDSHLGKND